VTPIRRIALACALLASSAIAAAQPSTAKKELVQKLLEQQRSELESISRSMVERPAAQLMQGAAQALQLVPADKREAVVRQIDTEVRKYIEESYAIVRERAIRIAPQTIGATLEEQLNEDELRQLLAFYSSPLNRKYQQLLPESRDNFIRKLLAESQPAVDPKLQALDARIRAVLTPAMSAASAAPARSRPASGVAPGPSPGPGLRPGPATAPASQPR